MGVSRADYTRMPAVASVDKHKHYCSFPNFESAVRLKPKSVCTVKFMEYTPTGGLYQPAFKGLRDDKAPRECVLPGIGGLGRICWILLLAHIKFFITLDINKIFAKHNR